MILFIYNDYNGEYILLRGYTLPEKETNGVFINSGSGYLDEIDLKF